MSEVSIEVTPEDQASFEDTLVRWMVLTGKSAPEVIRKQARLIAVNLAHNTQPYGFDQGARQRGERATARDIARVYVPVTKIFATIAATNQDAARGFIQAVQTGNVTHAREILHAFKLTDLERVNIGPFDPSIHEQLRRSNRRGRISPRLKPRLIVTDPTALSKYSKAMVKRVGFGKSAWASCADRFGGSRGIPQWAKRHRAPANVVDRTSDPNNPHVVMTSLVKFSDVILPDSMQRDALDKQAAKMETELRIALEKSGRDSHAVV